MCAMRTTLEKHGVLETRRAERNKLLKRKSNDEDSDAQNVKPCKKKRKRYMLQKNRQFSGNILYTDAE